MSAMRSAFMRLCRHSLAGGRPGIRQAISSLTAPRTPLHPTAPRTPFRPAAPRTPLPPSRSPAAPGTSPLPPDAPAARNVEGWQHLSTEGMMSADQNKQLLMKLESVSALRMWLQRSSDLVKNAAEAYRSPGPMCAAIACMASWCYMVWTFRTIHYSSFDRKYDESYEMSYYYMFPALRVMHPY